DDAALNRAVLEVRLQILLDAHGRLREPLEARALGHLQLAVERSAVFLRGVLARHALEQEIRAEPYAQDHGDDEPRRGQPAIKHAAVEVRDAVEAAVEHVREPALARARLQKL